MFGSKTQLIITIALILTTGCVISLTASVSVYCESSSYSECDNGFRISYPFYEGGFTNNNDDCGYHDLEINCLSNGKPVMNISNNLYYVLNINTESRRVTVVGKDIDEQQCPRPTQNFTLNEAASSLRFHDSLEVYYFYNCTGYPETMKGLLPCLYTNYIRNATRKPPRSFVLDIRDYDDLSSINCQQIVTIPGHYINDTSDYIGGLKLGFDLYWSTSGECLKCEQSGGRCIFNKTSRAFHLCSCHNGTRIYHRTCPTKAPIGIMGNTPSMSTGLAATKKGVPTVLKAITGVCTGVGALLLTLLLIYKRKRSLLNISSWKYKIRTPTNVEVFLENGGCFGLQRYRYSEIKSITNSLKETLGKGGFGSVYKGKLGDGRLVAVKVLDELKGNGEDFINEVTTIGRTNHVNVVSLLGYCSSGMRRALVYEFMPNGSLEKFIYDSRNKSRIIPSLGWEKLYQIALGIARGLEYLHRGCNTRILHFDIKPHNILLDQDFSPKISDFGLAKLCATRESVVSMSVARGTIGYLAPEVYCRNFGGVSHKSDVYSYGMMVLEMIGGRKNIDATVENTSEIYFPRWIYNHFKQDNIVGDSNELFQEETTKKMVVVALWCIQTQPADRPSMSKVVDMLEENSNELQMPPCPFLDSPSRHSP